MLVKRKAAAQGVRCPISFPATLRFRQRSGNTLGIGPPGATSRIFTSTAPITDGKESKLTVSGAATRNSTHPHKPRADLLDESLLLSEQDEDLVIGRRDLLPPLMPLAGDPACPKADYILSSFDFYMMFVAGLST
jgi:hypothetical protein